MEYRKFGKRYILRVDPDEEVIEQVTKLCKEEDIRLGSIVGIGAAKQLTVGLFNTVEKKYYKKDMEFPMEITSLIGNITRKDGEPYLHIHITVCDGEMHAFGGHLNRCVISATGEFVITRYKGEVGRGMNEQIGLNLFKF